MELTAQMIALLMAVGTVGVWFLTVVYTGLFKLPKPSVNVMKIIVFVVSLGLAFFWAGVQLPVFDGDVSVFIGALLAIATLVFKGSQLIYDILWKPIMEWLAVQTTALAFLSPSR